MNWIFGGAALEGIFRKFVIQACKRPRNPTLPPPPRLIAPDPVTPAAAALHRSAPAQKPEGAGN